MTGLSYPGIAQLFVAQTHPPSLAAITPLSVIGNTYTTRRPGGIFNDGFALEWITEVLDKAAPYGQGWEKPQVATGDMVCADNQLLHGQAVNVIQQAKDDAVLHRRPRRAARPHRVREHDRRARLPRRGLRGRGDRARSSSRCSTSSPSSPLTRFTIYNGVHPDGFAPQVVVEWKAFLDIYVAHKVPVDQRRRPQIAPALFAELLPGHRRHAARSLRRLPRRPGRRPRPRTRPSKPVRVLFESGGGTPARRARAHLRDALRRLAARRRHAAPPLLPARRLAPGTPPTGRRRRVELPARPGRRASAASSPPAATSGIRSPTTTGRSRPPGNDVVIETAPLTQDLVMLGSASVDLWIRSPVDDADLEVNLMEVRPDGQERFVQSGWLRASLRKLGRTATELWPEHTYTQADEALLVPGAVDRRRASASLRSATCSARARASASPSTRPGDSRAAWTFALKTFPGTVVYDIAHSATYPSSVVLPVLAGVASTTPLPPCPSLRAQQCRTYVPYTNTPSINP